MSRKSAEESAKKREDKGDTGRLGRRKEKQETARRPQETAGRRREMQGIE